MSFPEIINMDKISIDKLVKEQAKKLALEIVAKKEAARKRREKQRREEAGTALIIGRLFLRHARRSGITENFEIRAKQMLDEIFPVEK